MTQEHLTRAQLRAQRENENNRSRKENKRAAKEFDKKNEEIDRFYEKENRKLEKKSIRKSRLNEQQKYDRRAKRLNIAIAIVSLLIVALWVLIFIV